MFAALLVAFLFIFSYFLPTFVCVLDALAGWFSSSIRISLNVSLKFTVRVRRAGQRIFCSSNEHFLSFAPQTCLPVRVKVACSLYIHGPHGCARYFLGWFAALFIFPWAGWVCTSTYISFHKLWKHGFAALQPYSGFFSCSHYYIYQISHAVFFPPMCAWCLARIIVQLYLHFLLALVRVSVLGAFAGWSCSCNWKPSHLSPGPDLLDAWFATLAYIISFLWFSLLASHMVLFGSQVISLLDALGLICLAGDFLFQMFAVLFCFLSSIAGELGQSPIQSSPMKLRQICGSMAWSAVCTCIKVALELMFEHPFSFFDQTVASQSYWTATCCMKKWLVVCQCFVELCVCWLYFLLVIARRFLCSSIFRCPSLSLTIIHSCPCFDLPVWSMRASLKLSPFHWLS